MTEERPILTEDYATELAYGKGHDQFEFVAKEFIDSGRWSNYHLIVFRVEGDTQLWGFDYDEPATEMQEGMDTFSFEGNSVAVFPVIAEEVTTTVYKRVPGVPK